MKVPGMKSLRAPHVAGPDDSSEGGSGDSSFLPDRNPVAAAPLDPEAVPSVPGPGEMNYQELDYSSPSARQEPPSPEDVNASAHRLFGKSADQTMGIIRSAPVPPAQQDYAPPSIQPGVSPLSLPDKTSPLEGLYADASKVPADRSAQVLRLSQKFDQSPTLIDKNLDQAQKAASAPGPSFFNDLEKEYPEAVKFLQKPENMAVAHDDLPNVKDHAALVKGASETHGFWDTLQRDLTAGYQESLPGLAERTYHGKGMPDTVLPVDAPWYDRWAAGGLSLALDLPAMAVSGAVGTPLGALAGAIPGAATANPILGAVGAAGGAYVGGEYASWAVPAAAKAYLRQKLALGGREAAGSEWDQTMAILKEANKAGMTGVLTGGLGNIGGALGGTFAKLGTEAVAMPTISAGLEGRLPTQNEVIDTPLLLATMHLAAGGREALQPQRIADMKAKASSVFYNAFGKAAEESKIRDRLPEVHQDMVDKLAQGSPVQDVYLPVEAATAYFQKKGMDLSQVAEELGVKNEYEEAKATGGDLKVPLAKWVNKFEGTEHYKALERDVKFSPNDLTLNESAAAETEGQAAAKAIEEEATKKEGAPADAGSAEQLASGLRIFQDMQQKLKNAGLSARETGLGALLHESVFSTFADAINKDGGAADPFELSQAMPLNVRKFDSRAARDQEIAAQAGRFDFGANVESHGQGTPTLRNTPVGAGMEATAKQGSRQERLALARKALESLSDVHKDDVADALGISRPSVRALRGVPERQGRGTYSHDEIRKAAGVEAGVDGSGKSFDQSPKPPIGNVLKIDFQKKLAEQPKEISGDVDTEEGNAKFNSSVVDGSKFFPPNENTGKVDQAKESQKLLDSLVARYGDGKEGKAVEKAVKKAQDPSKGPYVGAKQIKGFGLVPNFAAEPTGKIGPERISQPHDLTAKTETDPLAWYDTKYHATKELIAKHAAEDKPLTINTSSDLVGHADYIDAMPRDTTVNMYAITRSNEINRLLFPGNPSRKRQETAIDHLREAGVKVNKIEPTRESLIDAAGGIKEVAKKLGIEQSEVPAAIDRALGPRLVSLDQGGAMSIESDLQTEIAIPEKVRSVNVEPDSSLGGMERKDIRKRSMEFAKDPANRGEVANDHTGWKIEISGEGLKKSANFAVRPEQALGLENIRELITNGTFLRSEAGRNEELGKVDYAYLYSPFESDGKSYIAKIAVRDGSPSGRNQKTFYSLHVQEIKPSAEGNPDYRSGAALPGLGERTVNKAELFRRVNEAREKSPLFQGEESDPLGQITFTNGNVNLDLFKGANVSTQFHELGHYYLEALRHVSENAGKDSKYIQEIASDTLKALGVNSWNEIKTEHHEYWAESWEKYLAEGKAPSQKLERAFSTFKDWLTNLWKQVKPSDVEVSPEMRAVFDRLLATKEDIEAAKKSVNMAEKLELPGLDDITKRDLESLRKKARDQAEATILKERLKETKDDYKEKLAAETARLRPEVEEEVRNQPLFQVVESLKDAREGDPYETAQAYLDGKLTDEQKAYFDLLADEHGFPTSEAMATAIKGVGEQGLFEASVKDGIQQRLEGMGLKKNAADLREEALRAVHQEDMTELLSRERAALLELAGKKIITTEARRRNREIARVEAQAANEEAQRIIAAKPAVEAGKPQTYITMERNAAARVAKFVAKKDFEKAAEAKKQQMAAHALVRESFKASEEAEKHFKFLEQFQNRGASMLDMPYGFVRQIDQMLARFGFQAPRGEDGKTLSAVAKGMIDKGENPVHVANATGYAVGAGDALAPESLKGFVDRVNQDGFCFELPEIVSSSAHRDMSTLTLDELKGVRETVQNIAHLGKKWDRFKNEFIKVDMKEAAGNLFTSIKENYGFKHAEKLEPGSKIQGPVGHLVDSLLKFPDATNRTLDTILTICHKLDGLEEGPAKEFLYRPVSESEARKSLRLTKAMGEVEAIFAKHYERGEIQKYKDEKIAVGNRAFTKEEILCMALNWGNNGNRQRLMDGFKFSEGKMREIFKNLGKRDWDFAQETWNHINQYWPEAVALEMAVNGIEPTKIQANKFTNEHGSYEGGYYPAAYDHEKSADAFMNNQSKDARFKQYSTAKAATAQGALQSRVVRVTRPLRLSLDVLMNHHEDMIHDLEYRKTVIDLNRFLSMPDVKNGIANAMGVRGYGAFQEWLKAIAGGSSEPTTVWDQSARWFRFKTTFFNLGAKIVTAPKIAIENVVNASAEIGVSNTVRSLVNYWTPGSQVHESVIEKSAYMKQRANHLDRDMGDLLDRTRGDDKGLVSKGLSAVTGKDIALQKYAFWVHAYLDQAVSFPVWSDVYKRAMAANPENERLAIHQADEAVKRSFMTGGTADQARIMRGGEVGKAMTTAYGYTSMMWNRFSLQNFKAGKEWADGKHIQAAATMARSTLYTFAMPALVASLTREFFRNAPAGNQDERKKRITGTVLEEMSPLKFIPVIRDLQSFAINKALGESTRDLQLTPIEGAMQALLQPGIEIASGKPSKRLPEETVHSLSFLAGVPKQIDDWAFNFIDWQKTNGQVAWRDALSRRRKK